ncbi:MAG TPA: hypothetical protein DIU15_20500, partial [Deltaproteobacteria bacterium]|nr:hypothetical protein [Deltaproteobacteria bacterium]
MTDRILITGTGMVTAAGIGMDACWQTLLRGESCIGPLTLWDAAGMASQIAGQVSGDPDVPAQLGPYPVVGRPMTFGVSAALEAMAQAGLDATLDIPPSRRAVVAAGGFDDQMLVMMARGVDTILPSG